MIVFTATTSAATYRASPRAMNAFLATIGRASTCNPFGIVSSCRSLSGTVGATTTSQFASCSIDKDTSTTTRNQLLRRIRRNTGTHNRVYVGYGSYYRSFSSSSLNPSPSASTDEDVEWFIWGTNKNGFLNSLIENNSSETKQGDDDKATASPDVLWEPTPVTWVPSDDDPNNKIKEIVCGPALEGGASGGKNFATVVVMENGDVYVSGDNTYGYLGVGHDQAIPTLTKLENVDSGSDESDNKLPPISKVVLGASSMALISQEGDLYTCGYNGDLVTGSGWLGHGTSSANITNYTLPKRVESLVEDGCYVDNVVLGENHMTVLTTEGEVLTCGICSYGRLGNGETHGVDQLYLEPVEVLPNDNNIISTIGGGKSFTLALHSKEGVIYGWGRNHKGQLGTGFGMAVDMYSMENVPTPMDSSTDILLNQKVISMSCGPSHAACITESNELYIWGMGTHLEPHKVTQVLHTPIVAVYCGGNDTTIAVSEDGQLYVWGNHGKKTGMLGLSHAKIIQNASNTTLRHQPQLLRNLAIDHFVHDVSMGTIHTVAKCTKTHNTSNAAGSDDDVAAT